MADERPWTIAVGDGFWFDIVRETPRHLGEFGSDADLNGRFATKLEAVEKVVADFEETRRELAKAIARAKRMRARLTCEGGDHGK